MAYTSMGQLPKVCLFRLISRLAILNLQQIHDELNQTFLSGITLPIEWRQNQLRQLAKMFLENHKAFADSILKVRFILSPKDLGNDALTDGITGSRPPIHGDLLSRDIWMYQSRNSCCGYATQVGGCHRSERHRGAHLQGMDSQDSQTPEGCRSSPHVRLIIYIYVDHHSAESH